MPCPGCNTVINAFVCCKQLHQFGCKDVCTPEFTDTIDWSVKIKSVQEELFVWICVGSFINWEKPFKEVS